MSTRGAEQLAKFNQLCHKIDALYNSIAKQYGISDCELIMLYSLYEQGTMSTQKALCELWAYSKQTVNSTLKKMEQEGKVIICATEYDKRNKYVELTKHGKQYAKEIVQPLMRAEQNVFEMMGEEDSNRYLAYMQQHYDLFYQEVERMKVEEI